MRHYVFQITARVISWVIILSYVLYACYEVYYNDTDNIILILPVALIMISGIFISAFMIILIAGIISALLGHLINWLFNKEIFDY